ncbi:MAG: hypothetical protein U0T83_08815 [Bacteriovoracaceae bacterium]
MNNYERCIDSPKFNREEFFEKWERARKAACISILKAKNINANYFMSERDLLKLIDNESKETLYKNVFDNSRKFALSAMKYLGFLLEISDFKDLLMKSDIPCFSGKWDEAVDIRVLRRDGCALGLELKAIACDYYREALDGFIMGSSDNERYARHESMGNGDKSCIDVFFIENSNREQNFNIRFKPIESEVITSFEKIKEEYRKSNIDLKLLGMAEGKLFYMLDCKSGPLCQSTGKYFHKKFQDEAKALYPNLLLQDMLPVAVYGSGA